MSVTPLSPQDVLQFFQSGLIEIEGDPSIPASISENGTLPTQSMRSVACNPTPSKLASHAPVDHVTLEEFQQFWEDDPAADQDLVDFSAFVGDVFDDDHHATPAAAATATPVRALSSAALSPSLSSLLASQIAHVDQMLGQVSAALQTLNSQSQAQVEQNPISLTYDSLFSRSRFNINSNVNSKAHRLDAKINPCVSAWLSHKLVEQEATQAQLVTQENPSIPDSTSITNGVPFDSTQTQTASPSSSNGRFGLVQTKKWNDKYKEIIQFRQVHGHVLIPLEYKENPQLAHWVKRQRAQYKQLVNGNRSAMTTDRIQLLEDVGFVWDSHRAAWQGRWSELKEFRDINGHANVFSGDNQELSAWMKCQRRQYKLHCNGKASSMTTERIDQLNSLGVVWAPRGERK